MAISTMFCMELLSFVLFLLLPTTKAAMPGTFFWRPRFGLDLGIPTTEPAITAYKPNKQNIASEIVVLLDGYDIMTSILGLLFGASYAANDEMMDPAEGMFITNVYRWTLRAVQLFPQWFRGNFHEALGVWHSRFKYMDAQVPVWLRKAFPWITKESWDKENIELKKYRKESESAFSPFYRFPSKTFHNFNSFLPDTVERFGFSSAKRDEVLAPETSSEKKETQNIFRKNLYEVITKVTSTPTTALTTTTTETSTTRTFKQGDRIPEINFKGYKSETQEKKKVWKKKNLLPVT